MSDYLSARITTDSTGTVVGEQGHYPFGESWYSTSATTKWQFTSYERDSESGSDYAMMRYDSSRLGRFSSPDPLAGSIVDPQSLNRYAYVVNDPVNLTDPSGLKTPDLIEPVAWAEGDSWMFGGPICIVDGVEQSCGSVQGLLGGAALQCPNNDCTNVLSVTTGPNGETIFTVRVPDNIVTRTLFRWDDDQGKWVPSETQSDVQFRMELITVDNSSLPSKEEFSWWGTFARSFFHNFSLKPTGKAGKYGNCVESNRLDNALRSLAAAYGHPEVGNALAGATLVGTGASLANVAADATLGAQVPGLLGRSAHSSTWMRTIFGPAGRLPGRIASGAAAILLVGEAAYDATAMVTCAVTD